MEKSNTSCDRCHTPAQNVTSPSGVALSHACDANTFHCSCCTHDDDGNEQASTALPGWPRLIGALALALAAELVHLLGGGRPLWQMAGMALAIAAIGLAGLGIYRNGIRTLLRGKLRIDALMAVAVTGAFIIGQWPEAGMVMALYAIAERIEEAAADRARHAISALMQLAPDQADMRNAQGQWQTLPASAVPLHSIVRIRPGARIPLDGIVVQGQSAVDQASVTGESIPVDKTEKDPLFAGTINTTGELLMRVTATSGQTTLDRIIDMVEKAQSTRAPTQRFIERFAVIYTPGVLVLALAIALLTPALMGWDSLDAIYRALVVLVIACPCALVISVPVAIVSGLAAAARRNIIIKGGTYLENARKLKAIALDKTGTVTVGKPVLVHWQPWKGTDGETAASKAASLAQRSDHPISQAIVEGLNAPAHEVRDFQAIAGKGTWGRVAGEAMALANHRWIEERGQCSPALENALLTHQQQGRSVTMLACNQGVQAIFAVADTIKPGAREAIAALHALGVRAIMLSGDHQNSAQAIALQAGIDGAHGDLLPQDKLDAIATLQKEYGAVGMVGDGINDAPALAQADIGFAMGAAGTGAALEAADVVIMNDDLWRVAETIELSHRTHRILWQNILLALGIKGIFLFLAIAGHATMWMAVFADVGTSLLVVANGLRMLRGPSNAR